jgi:anti-sigma B factor antagonist
LAPRALRVAIEHERDVVRVCPYGEIDLDTVDAVRAQVDKVVGAGFDQVVLDLRGATFVDSTGLRLAIDVQAAAATDGWKFALIPGPPNLQRAFEISGLSEQLDFVEPAVLQRPGRQGHR